MVKDMKEITKVIKQSICYRAKYRKHAKKYCLSGEVVPHPKNRGGEVVKSVRTKEINGMVLKAGYCNVESFFNAVCIEAEPAVAGVVSKFQKAFAESVATDPDMAVSLPGIIIQYGSVAHSHATCGKRNIIAGKKGCVCDDAQLKEAGGKCAGCDASPILDSEGRYSSELLKSQDFDFGHGLQGGE